MRDKAVLRQKYLDQIELDKLQGLENGRICRAVYKEAQRKAAERKARA